MFQTVFLVSRSGDKAEIAELFASRPLEVGELYADPFVQTRIRNAHNGGNEYTNEAATPNQVSLSLRYIVTRPHRANGY